MTTQLQHYAGMRVIVHRPLPVTVRLGWRERLRSWRPWIATRQTWTLPVVPEDGCMQIGTELHCGENFYARLQLNLLAREYGGDPR